MDGWLYSIYSWERGAVVWCAELGNVDQEDNLERLVIS